MTSFPKNVNRQIHLSTSENQHIPNLHPKKKEICKQFMVAEKRWVNIVTSFHILWIDKCFQYKLPHFLKLSNNISAQIIKSNGMELTKFYQDLQQQTIDNSQRNKNQVKQIFLLQDVHQLLPVSVGHKSTTNRKQNACISRSQKHAVMKKLAYQLPIHIFNKTPTKISSFQ